MDGNITLCDDDVEDNHLVKVEIVAESKECAEETLLKYYIQDLDVHFSEKLTYIEDKSGETYKGTDSCYNEGNNQLYFFSNLK